MFQEEDPARFSDTSWQIHRQWSLSHARAFPSVEGAQPPLAQGPVIGDRPPSGAPSNSPAPTSVTQDNNNNQEATRETAATRQSHDVTSKPASKILPPSPITMSPPCRRGSGAQMDLVYVTERIIALSFPERIPPTTLLEARLQVKAMLAGKHGDGYMVFNLSPPVPNSQGLGDTVEALGPHKAVGWSRGLAPPLERLCSVCKDIDIWLAGNRHRIAVLHARGDKQRLGAVVAAYMHYSAICGSEEQALDRFSMKRFLEESVGALQLPSHKRYVEYFAGLLSGSIRINAAPLFLTHVSVLGAPHFMQHGGCRAFLKVYEGLAHVYTSGIYSVSSAVRQFTVNLGGLRLRGDVLIKCYHRAPLPATGAGSPLPRGAPEREVIFACQFHTCAVSDFTLHFGKQELDAACDDPRFPSDGGVTLTFSATPAPSQAAPQPAPTPAVPVEGGDHVTRWDSLAELQEHTTDSANHQHNGSRSEDTEEQSGHDGDESNAHTYGPLDGSLYATISKKQESVTSPLTVSMDSGISSAGPAHNHAQRHAHSSASSSSPPLATPSTVPSHPSPAEDRHRELDELLSDMMMNVQNIPDVPPPHSAPPFCTPRDVTDQLYHGRPRTMPAPTAAHTSSHQQSANVSQSVSIRRSDSSAGPAYSEYLDKSCRLNEPNYYRVEGTTVEEQEGEIPYHAREDSTPFTYGAVPPAGSVPQNGSIMIKMQSGLSSPSLVRKASGKNQNNNVTGKSHSVTFDRDPIEDLFTSSANESFRRTEGSDDVFKRSPSVQDTMRRSHTDGALRSHTVSRSPLSPTNGGTPMYTTQRSLDSFDSTSSGLTWLQLQQQKLRARKEVQLREDRRPLDTRLFTELRTTSHRHSRPTASHRLDGYTSDTTAFADDDEDFTVPLHVNTVQNSHNRHTPNSPVLPHRTSSRKYYTITNHSTTESRNGSAHMNGARERPFVAVKRAHEQNKKISGSPLVSPAQALASAPMGLAYGRSDSRTSDSIDSGLLSFADHDSVSPRRFNGTMNPAQKHDALANLIASLAEACPASPSPSPATTASETPHSPHSDSPFDTPPLPPPQAWMDQMREESISSWRTMSTSEAETSPTGGSPRAQTPAFPVHPRTPYAHTTPTHGGFESPGGLPPKSPTTQRRLSGHSTSSSTRTSSTLKSPQTPTEWSKDLFTPNGDVLNHHSNLSGAGRQPNGTSSPTSCYTLSRRSSTHSNEPLQEVSPALVKFARDSSKFWYKPNITREEAINLIRDKPPGTFVVRDSNSFANAYGLALKVASPPAGVVTRNGPPGDELVRHFLVEPTAHGVRLKGCNNEPVFSSLSALVYQHSLTPLALPCKLLIPDGELSGAEHVASPAAVQLLTQGAACNVLYLYSIDTESLTGPQAVRKAVSQLFAQRPLPQAAVVHFKVSGQGITLTDNTRKLFFRRHYKASNISHCGLDPDDHRWSVATDSNGVPITSNRVFAFVARRAGSSADNQCHVFAELEAPQPASAIVSFVEKVILGGQPIPL